MFRGISSVTMDAKGRMALPSRYRDAVAVASGGRVVVTIDMRESCLLLYPLAEWEQVKQTGTSFQHQSSNKIASTSVDWSCDGLGVGRRWPFAAATMLRDFVFNEKLVLVGQGNKIEKWSADHWRQRPRICGWKKARPCWTVKRYSTGCLYDGVRG